MKPSGNLPYDPSSSWAREDEITTAKLLDGLTRRFIWTQAADFGEVAHGLVLQTEWESAN
jgi:hypothetical protein